MRKLVLIVHNVRSAHNVGSLLRTAEGLGIAKVWLTGYTPYPRREHDERLPHLADKLDRQIIKTSLGAEQTLEWSHSDDIEKIVEELKKEFYPVVALEQAAGSVKLPGFKPQAKLALIVGREVEGIEPEVLALCDQIIEIPMLGKKESYNVAQAAAIALYHCRFTA